ncbi:MAG: anaerobic ribonucleoside-triphosphate reductase activating protein [Flavobacteriaceae bacterium]|nr:anaerobic ribonucleoside-triphosphate reductase activating protein [Flavobacteriaceae bacterium]|tara:strand:- start:3924 stop:4382 length:459 start_codon:yes stop_codon:yes gene_type:complete
MYYFDFQVVLQEVPGEISLCFSISGCKLQCNGCHSPFLWKENNGTKLSLDTYFNKIIQYKDQATCVLFMGGEWHKEELITMLQLANKYGYKTCLYTGEEVISDEIKKHLTFLKTGRWEKELGGLENKNTNQLFIEVASNLKLNYLFSKNQNI